MAKVTTLRELCLNELRDLYDAENRIVDALPKVAQAVSAKELQKALVEHLEQSKGHVHRLEKVFVNMNEEPKRKTCDGIKGILAEGEAMISDCEDDAVRDAGIIAAAQRVEHYEMAVYGSVRTWADELGDAESAQVLQQTLDEEKEADNKLSGLARSHTNDRARAASAGA